MLQHDFLAEEHYWGNDRSDRLNLKDVWHVSFKYKIYCSLHDGGGGIENCDFEA